MDSTTILEQIAASQAQKEVTANALFDAGSISTIFGRHSEACIALTWGYYGGRVGGVSVANGTLSLTASRRQYIVVDLSSGTVSVSTSATNWCTPETYGRLYLVDAGAASVTSYQDHRFGKWGVFPMLGGLQPDRVEIVLPVGDVSTSVTTGTTKVVRRAPANLRLTSVRAALATASTSGAPAIDVNVDGVSIFGTTLTIDQNEKTSTTAATASALAELGSVIADDAEVSIDVDSAGSGAAGLVVTLSGLRGIGDRFRELVSFHLPGTGANGGTTFTDVSPTPKTVTRIGNTVTSTAVADPFGGTSSLYFDGTGDGLSIPFSSDVSFASSDFCISGFGYSIATTGFCTLIELRGSGTSTDGWLVQAVMTDRAIRVFDGPTATAVILSANNVLPAATNWFHWMVTRSGTTTRLFVDGTLVGSATYNPPATSSTGIRFGLTQAGVSAWNGYMRDLVLTKYAPRRTAAFTAPRRAHPAY